MTETTQLRIICKIELPQNNRISRNDKLETTIATIIDQSLSSFGDAFKQSVYIQLEKNQHIKSREIPRRIDEFANTLETMFGIGAALIEMKIMKTLHERFPSFVYVPQGDALVFTDYVKHLLNSS